MCWCLIHTDRANAKHLQLKTTGANAKQNLGGDLDSGRRVLDGGDYVSVTPVWSVVLAARQITDIRKWMRFFWYATHAGTWV